MTHSTGYEPGDTLPLNAIRSSHTMANLCRCMQRWRDFSNYALLVSSYTASEAIFYLILIAIYLHHNETISGIIRFIRTVRRSLSRVVVPPKRTRRKLIYAYYSIFSLRSRYSSISSFISRLVSPRAIFYELTHLVGPREYSISGRKRYLIRSPY